MLSLLNMSVENWKETSIDVPHDWLTLSNRPRSAWINHLVHRSDHRHYSSQSFAPSEGRSVPVVHVAGS